MDCEGGCVCVSLVRKRQTFPELSIRKKIVTVLRIYMHMNKRYSEIYTRLCVYHMCQMTIRRMLYI